GAGRWVAGPCKSAGIPDGIRGGQPPVRLPGDSVHHRDPHALGDRPAGRSGSRGVRAGRRGDPGRPGDGPLAGRSAVTARGRRGPGVPSAPQKEGNPPDEISEQTYPEIGEVDAKLVAYAREHAAAILTNDFNLNRVAELQGIRVLNINELANAVKAVLHPGE